MMTSDKNAFRKHIKDKAVRLNNQGLMALVASDIVSYKGINRAVLCRGFWVIFLYRISNYLYKKKFNFLSKIMEVATSFLGGAEISRKAVLGRSILIYHPKGIFIGRYVHIVQNVNLGKNCFLGSNYSDSGSDVCPVIDEGTVISFGAGLFGKITIGKNVTVGPNAIVLKDVLDDQIVTPPTSRVIPKFKT